MALEGDWTPLQELKRPCRHPRNPKQNKEHLMRVHLKTIQCRECGATFGQQGLYDDHRKRKTACKPPAEFVPVAKETIVKAAEMTECDGSDEGCMYSILHDSTLPEQVLEALYKALHTLAASSSGIAWSKSIIPVGADKKELRHRQLSERETAQLELSDEQFLQFVRSCIEIPDGSRQGSTRDVQEYLGPPGGAYRWLPQLCTDSIPRTRQLSVELTPADSGYGEGFFTPAKSDTDFTEATTPSSYQGLYRSYSAGSETDAFMPNAWGGYQGMAENLGGMMFNSDEIALHGNMVHGMSRSPFEHTFGFEDEALHGMTNWIMEWSGN